MELTKSQPDFQLLAQALSAVAVGVAICDTDGRIAWVNAAFTDLSGYTFEDAVGQHTRILKSGLHDAAFYERMWTSLLNGEVFRGEIVNRRKDGSLYEERNTITPVTDASGRKWLIAMKEDVTAQSRAREAIARSDERFRALFEHAPDAYYLHDLGGIFLDGNKGAEAMIGYNREELIGRSFLESGIVPPESLGATLECLERSRAGSPAGPVEIALTHKLGHQVRVEVRTFPVEIQGKVSVLGIARDVTERNRAEMRRGILAELSEQLNPLTSLTTAAEVMASAVDRLVGWDACWIDFKDPNQPGLRRLFHQEETNGRRIPREGSAEFTADDEQRFGPALSLPIRNGSNVVGWIYVRRLSPGVYDVQEQQRLVVLLDLCGPALERIATREELFESEANYRALIDLLPDAVMVHADDVIVFANPAAVRLFGATVADELIGRCVFDFASAETCEFVRQRIQNSRAGNTSPSIELTVLRLDRTEFQAEVMSIPFTFRSKPAVQTVIRDVTERRRVEQQLQQAQKLEAIGTLAGGIAHDFNNILGAIIGYTQLAHMDAREHRGIRDSLDHVLRAGERAKQLVSQILTFSRQQKQERRPVRLQTVVKEGLQLLRATLPSTIELVTAIDADAPPVLADATQVHQVLMNLCTNAGHAMGMRPGRLEVTLAVENFDEGQVLPDAAMQPGTYVRLTVGDTGPGISPEHLRRIFEPFFTTKSPWEGTGLGLAVVHGIVREHGGGVTVRSELGAGATFEVYIPASDGRAVIEVDSSEPLPLGKGERILLVDDEPALADSARRLLERLGYRVTTFKDPARAIERFQGAPNDFDLVLTDLTMPRMTGADVAAAVFQCRADAKVVVATGYGDAWTRETLRRVGVKDCVRKPLSAQMLASTVKKVINGVDSEHPQGR